MVEKATKASSKETAAELREWDKIVDALPELVNPFDLPDEVQIELVAAVGRLKGAADDRLSDIDSALAVLREFAQVMPKLFVDADAFEEWRRELPLLKRAPTYQTIYEKYMKALGE